jgi:hypothetical protein
LTDHERAANYFRQLKEGTLNPLANEVVLYLFDEGHEFRAYHSSKQGAKSRARNQKSRHCARCGVNVDESGFDWKFEAQ